MEGLLASLFQPEMLLIGLVLLLLLGTLFFEEQGKDYRKIARELPEIQPSTGGLDQEEVSTDNTLEENSETLPNGEDYQSPSYSQRLQFFQMKEKEEELEQALEKAQEMKNELKHQAHVQEVDKKELNLSQREHALDMEKEKLNTDRQKVATQKERNQLGQEKVKLAEDDLRRQNLYGARKFPNEPSARWGEKGDSR